MHIANGIVMKYLRMVAKPVLVCRSYITAFTSTRIILQSQMTGIFFHSGRAEDSESIQMPPICYVSY